jgi:gas vesicle protein
MTRMNTTFLTGMLIGGVVGVTAALLSARQPGYAVTSLQAMRNRRAVRGQQPMLDDTIDGSFPASDPPSWTPASTTTGA